MRDAGAPGARCVQLPAIGPGGPSGSEDCLHLYVTAPSGAPARAPAGRPVMVWFHGGGSLARPRPAPTRSTPEPPTAAPCGTTTGPTRPVAADAAETGRGRIGVTVLS